MRERAGQAKPGKPLPLVGPEPEPHPDAIALLDALDDPTTADLPGRDDGALMHTRPAHTERITAMTEQPGPVVTVHGGDCLTVLRTLPDASVHAVVTDPPYGLSQVDSVKLTTALTAWVNGDRESVPGGKGFMGKEWDAFVPPPAVWDECLRVLKPGGHMLVFAGSRTVDLMGLSIRLAGFEIRDTLQWLYGSGFPKSMNVAKAIESGSGRPEDIRRMSMGAQYAPSGRGRVNYDNGSGSQMNGVVSEFTPATDAAREWSGWGTALKPAAEPIILARKPLASTVARNVLAHGVGGLNIDGCRVAHGSDVDLTLVQNQSSDTAGMNGLGQSGFKSDHTQSLYAAGGRFPANVLLTHNPDCDEQCDEGCPVAELDAQSGVSRSRVGKPRSSVAPGDGWGMTATGDEYADSGGASRFFPSFRYQAKAPKSERPKVDGVAHPTVKPLDLMRWLVRLITPPGGTVLDPFAGSGTTLQAAVAEGFSVIGIEREADYWPLIEHRTGVAVTPHAEPVGPEPEQVEADTVERDTIIDLVTSTAQQVITIPGVSEILERASAAESAAEAEAVRADLCDVLMAAQGAA